MSNDFLPFATGGGANVVTQSAYAALGAVSTGYQAGVAASAQLNKTWRQSSIMAAVLAQFIVDQSGQNAVDDGTTATLEANLITAIRNAMKTGVILADTGTANAYTAVNVPPLAIGTWVDGAVQQVKIAHANTGASTYAPDGLTVIPIYGLGLQPLQGGELALNGTAVLMRATIAGVNSGNPIAVLMECFGGAQQIAPATASQHAAQLQQIGHGQCRFVYTNATTCTLLPFNGQNLIINGVPQKVPTSGVTLSNSGLSASTGYYMYAFMNSGTMTLEASTTGYTTGTNGVYTKSADSTRTLVGQIYTNASSQFQFSNSVCGVLTWFNQFNIALQPVNGTGTLTATTPTEINSSLRVSTLVWSGKYLDATLDGFSSAAVSQAAVVTGIGIDSSTAINGQQSQGNSAFAGAGVPCSVRNTTSGTELTLHTFYALGYTSTGSGSWNLNMKVIVMA